jgi:hypothetical protein
MDAFKDEVYENMDDISKLVEPFEYSVNNDLSQFPDEIELDTSMLKSIISYESWSESWGQNLSFFVRAKSDSLGLQSLSKEIGFNNSNFVHSMFIFFDFENNIITGGKIFLRKKKIAVEDNDIESVLNATIVKTFDNNFFGACDVNKKRLNEIAEMFGAKQARKERSWRKKTEELRNHFQEIVKNKNLVIKDVELFKRFLNWNVMYIKDGKLPAMANLARIKIMMRNGMPIYSIKEEQV